MTSDNKDELVQRAKLAEQVCEKKMSEQVGILPSIIITFT
jgi:hypothetical protein